MPDNLAQPGDLFIAVNGDGTWGTRLTFVRFHDGRSDLGIFRDGDGQDYLMPFTSVKRPIRGQDSFAGNGPKGAAHKRILSPLSASQRRMIFGLAHRRRLTPDDVRDLCPTHSISKLTQAEAADLIDRLIGGRDSFAAKRPEGCSAQTSPVPASARSRNFARDLAAGAHMDRRAFARWLHKRHGVDSIDDPNLTPHNVDRIINGLKRMKHKRRELKASKLRKEIAV